METEEFKKLFAEAQERQKKHCNSDFFVPVHSTVYVVDFVTYVGTLAKKKIGKKLVPCADNDPDRRPRPYYRYKVIVGGKDKIFDLAEVEWIRFNGKNPEGYRYQVSFEKKPNQYADVNYQFDLLGALAGVAPQPVVEQAPVAEAETEPAKPVGYNPKPSPTEAEVDAKPQPTLKPYVPQKSWAEQCREQIDLVDVLVDPKNDAQHFNHVFKSRVRACACKMVDFYIEARAAEHKELEYIKTKKEMIVALSERIKA